MGTKKSLPKKINGKYLCSICGAEVYPCEQYCDECYTEIDWNNYNEEFFTLSEMWQSDKESNSNK